MEAHVGLHLLDCPFVGMNLSERRQRPLRRSQSYESVKPLRRAVPETRRGVSCSKVRKHSSATRIIEAARAPVVVGILNKAAARITNQNTNKTADGPRGTQRETPRDPSHAASKAVI